MRLAVHDDRIVGVVLTRLTLVVNVAAVPPPPHVVSVVPDEPVRWHDVSARS